MENFKTATEYVVGKELQVSARVVKYIGCPDCTGKICDIELAILFIESDVFIPYNDGLFGETRNRTHCECRTDFHLCCLSCGFVLGHQVGEYAQLKANVYVQTVSKF